MLVQFQRAQIDFEALLLDDPAGAGSNVEAQSTSTPMSPQVPVSTLTAMDLLNVEEVLYTALSAVQHSEPQKFISLQQRLVDTAIKLNIAPQQLEFLRSTQATDFMKFRAKRAWFNQEVQKRYYQLRSLDGLLEQFPEARGELYQDATTLIIDRDLIIFNMAKVLANAQERVVTEQDIANAQLQWQSSMSSLK